MPTAPENNRSTTIQFVTWWISKLLTPLLLLATGTALIFLVGLAQRIGWIQSGGAVSLNNTPTAAATAAHTCPMHPQIRQPGSGSCPICGMPLVAANSTAQTTDSTSVHINMAQRRLANIQTAGVRRGPVVEQINTVGSIAIDESRMATIASYFDGRIERLFADYTGVYVSQGDHLAIVYSGELFSNQVEYLENRRNQAENTVKLDSVRQTLDRLVVNSRQKLQELGLTEAQIVELEQTEKAQSRQTIYAPMGGTVIEKLAIEGKYVAAGEPIYRIADLTTVWLKLELYPEDAARIRFGQSVDARLASLPGEVLEGRVAFIAPTVDEEKRTVAVRVELLNDDGRLRPGDYADATIWIPMGQAGEVFDAGLAGKWISPMHPQIIRDLPGDCPICGMKLVSTSRYGYSETEVAQPESLYVPRSAVLMAGQHSVVYVETEAGRFQIRKVTLGRILTDIVVVASGLEEGERVATSGNFLIDSQMQLAGNPSLIDPNGALLQPERNTPLQIEMTSLTIVESETATSLDGLFAAYFRVQQSLAADHPPTEQDSVELHTQATRLKNDANLPSHVDSLIDDVVQHSKRLHQLDLDAARHDAFRPLSHAIIKLASRVQSKASGKTFHHMFCPMVKGGSGDWLQDSATLLNPYYGSQMLHCGEQVQALVVDRHTETDVSAESAHQANPSHHHRAE